MRSFHLQRLEDPSKISGTGVVAEGVEFKDGICVIHWLTHTNSTAVYSSISDIQKVHGHEGKTQIVFDGGQALSNLVEIPKPHLALGFEGPDAEIEAMAQGCGPVRPGARFAYDNVRKISAPPGWKASATFFQGGEVALVISSPPQFLYKEQVPASGDLKACTQSHYRRDTVQFMIDKDVGVRVVEGLGRLYAEYKVEVDGVVGIAQRVSYQQME